MPETAFDEAQKVALQSALLELMRCAAIKGSHSHGCGPSHAHVPCPPAPTDYLYEIARLQLEYYGRLLKFGIEVTDAILRKQSFGGCDPCATTTVVKVAGKAGEKVSGRFRVRNSNPHPVRLRFDVGPFRTSGQPPFYATIDFDAAERCLDPCEEIEVSFSCLLDANFHPAHTYICEISVAGRFGQTVCLHIDVSPDKNP